MESFSNPGEMLAFWLRHSARWQAHLTKTSSGSVQKILRNSPDWFNMPFLLAYGTARPLLPSALTAWSTPVWRFVGIWRALGWTLLLPLLVYAPLRAFRSPEKRHILLGLSAAVWAGILIAAFWGGGDLWDNPRYRVAFSPLQLTLAAGVLSAQLREPDPWMRRAIGVVLAVFIWFMPWYIRRYTAYFKWWPVADLLKLVGLGIATGVLFAIWDWARKSKAV